LASCNSAACQAGAQGVESSGDGAGKVEAQNAGQSGQQNAAGMSQSQNRPGSDEAGVSGGAGLGPPTTAGAEEQRQQLALELVDDLREGTLDAMAVVPKSSALAKLRETLERVSHSGGSPRNVVALASEISPPLGGLISVLYAELAHCQRQHELTDPQIEQAPAAYRPAVADYFEQLSRDYQSGADREVSSE
jgi:hypothetical protein